MPIRPRYKSLDNICETSYTANGKTYPHFCATVGTQNGKRIRIHAQTMAECRRRVNAWYDQRESAGDGIAALSVKEVADAILAFDTLKKAGVSATLSSIADDWVKRHGTSVSRKRLTDAYDAYYNRLTPDQMRTKECVKKRIGRFVAAHPQSFVDEITTDMVRRHLDGMGDIAPKTWNNHMCDLRTFFNWCMLKVNRFCQSNPVADMEKRKIRGTVPECAEITSVRMLFSYLYNNRDLPHRDLLMFRMALNYFGGVRVDETKRQSPDDVRLADGSVLIRDPKGSQTGRVHFRVFRIDDCGYALRKWMEAVDFDRVANDALMPASYDKIARMARIACKGAFPDNAGRHSFISYHVAAFGNPKMTEGIVGTGDDMRKCSYQSPRTKAEGDAYFSITPQSVSATP